VTVEICNLGACDPPVLIAEYDAERDAIRVNARAVDRVRRTLGEAAATQFVACAVAHERFHREHPRAGEAAAHAYARSASGADPHAFEEVLR
jgi:aldehyde:ferredoxin oxidoreductase